MERLQTILASRSSHSSCSSRFAPSKNRNASPERLQSSCLIKPAMPVTAISFLSIRRKNERITNQSSWSRIPTSMSTRRRFLSRGLALYLAFSFSSTLAQTLPPADAYLDPALPLDQRVGDLVGRMTHADKISQMQNKAPAIPRLHTSEYDCWNEGLHGVARSGHATVCPHAIGLAA